MSSGPTAELRRRLRQTRIVRTQESYEKQRRSSPLEAVASSDLFGLSADV